MSGFIEFGWEGDDEPPIRIPVPLGDGQTMLANGGVVEMASRQAEAIERARKRTGHADPNGSAVHVVEDLGVRHLGRRVRAFDTSETWVEGIFDGVEERYMMLREGEGEVDMVSLWIVCEGEDRTIMYIFRMNAPCRLVVDDDNS